MEFQMSHMKKKTSVSGLQTAFYILQKHTQHLLLFAAQRIQLPQPAKLTNVLQKVLYHDN